MNVSHVAELCELFVSREFRQAPVLYSRVLVREKTSGVVPSNLGTHPNFPPISMNFLVQYWE